MGNNSAKIAPQKRQWIAKIHTRAVAKAGAELPAYQKREISTGTRLTGLLMEELNTQWRFKDGKIDGKALPRTIRFIDKNDWCLLIEESFSLAEPEEEASLTADYLVATCWSFGEEGRRPWSTNVRFELDGRLSGQVSFKHSFWSLNEGCLSIFNGDQQLTFISDTVGRQANRLNIHGFSLSDPTSHRRLLAEVSATADSAGIVKPTMATDNAMGKAMAAPSTG